MVRLRAGSDVGEDVELFGGVVADDVIIRAHQHVDDELVDVTHLEEHICCEHKRTSVRFETKPFFITH